MMPNNIYGGQPPIPFHVNFSVPPPPLPANVPCVSMYRQPPPPLPPPPPPLPMQPQQTLSPFLAQSNGNPNYQTHVTTSIAVNQNSVQYTEAHNDNQGVREHVDCSEDCDNSCQKCLQGKLRLSMYLEQQKIFNKQEEYYSLMCSKAEKEIKHAQDMVMALVGPELSRITEACVDFELELHATSLQSNINPVVEELMRKIDSATRQPSCSHPTFNQARIVQSNVRTSHPAGPAYVPAQMPPYPSQPGSSDQHRHHPMRSTSSSPTIPPQTSHAQHTYTRHSGYNRNNIPGGRHYSHAPHHHRKFHRQPPS